MIRQPLYIRLQERVVFDQMPPEKDVLAMERTSVNNYLI